MSEVVLELLFALWFIVTLLLGIGLFVAFGLAAVRAVRRKEKRLLIPCAVFVLGGVLCILLNPAANLAILQKPYHTYTTRMSEFRGTTSDLLSAYGTPAQKVTRSECEYWNYHVRPWYILWPVGTVTYNVKDDRIVNGSFDY